LQLLIYFSRDMHRVLHPNPNIKVDIWHPAVGLRWIISIARAFDWLKCLGGIMHLKPTAGCQISTLIFGFWGGTLPYAYLMKVHYST
jgi:hypothetical protein